MQGQQASVLCRNSMCHPAASNTQTIWQRRQQPQTHLQDSTMQRDLNCFSASNIPYQAATAAVGQTQAISSWQGLLHQQQFCSKAAASCSNTPLKL
jgi:hypothetical protein